MEACPAGLQAHGKNPQVIAVTRKAGIDHCRPDPTLAMYELVARANRVITVCGHAAEECPAPPATVPVAVLADSGPPKARGSADETAAIFGAGRNDIQSRRTERDTAQARFTGPSLKRNKIEICRWDSECEFQSRLFKHLHIMRGAI